ncbi:MAG: TrmH family RNA methyltransferase [Acidimicrobiales bacterium]
MAYRHGKVQRLRRLVRQTSMRRAEAAFVAEGAKVISVALDAGAAIEAIYCAPGARGHEGCAEVIERVHDGGGRVFDLDAGVMERVADTVTPQPVLAVMGFVDVELVALANAGLVVVGVGIRDPGNAGTLLRSAEAAGADGVVLCDGSVDLYNPKTVRASAGSLFHIPVVAGGEAVDVLGQLGNWGIARVGTRAQGGTEYDRIDLSGRLALVLGNEARGLDDEVVACLDDVVTVPMRGRSESLNVGMAAAVLCFEAARQQRWAEREGGEAQPLGARPLPSAAQA